MLYDGFFGCFFFLNITTDHKEYCDYFYMTVHNVKNLQLIKLYKIYYFYPFWARAARQNRGFLAFGAQGAPKFSIWQREPKPKMPMSAPTPSTHSYCITVACRVRACLYIRCVLYCSDGSDASRTGLRGSIQEYAVTLLV